MFYWNEREVRCIILILIILMMKTGSMKTERLFSDKVLIEYNDSSITFFFKLIRFNSIVFVIQ